LGNILDQVRRAHERAELRSKGIAAEKETPDRLVKWIGKVLLQSLKHEGGIVGGTRKTVKRFGPSIQSRPRSDPRYRR
jgi:hypothetical protein